MSLTPEPLSYPLVREIPTEPPPQLAEMRKNQPVCPLRLPTGSTAWIVTRHADVRKVLADRRFSRAALVAPQAPRSQFVDPEQHMMSSMDPPEHGRVRRLANPRFTLPRINALRHRIEELAEELAERMAAMPPPVDLNTAYCVPLTKSVISWILGVPPADQQLFDNWNDHYTSLTKYTGEEMRAARQDMDVFFRRLVAAKREAPGDDLISDLLQHTADGVLTESEIVALGIFLLLAGYETVATAMGSAVVTLLDHPEELATLRTEPERYPAAVEELLRLNGLSGSALIRLTTAEVELGGTVLPAGSAVIPSVGSGCRDERVFSEPDRFDVDRQQHGQLAFGHGPHFCIGADLARTELEIGLRVLMHRFPTLKVAVPHSELRWKDYSALGGWEQMPVEWT
jgi:nocardicin N-oxygenase